MPLNRSSEPRINDRIRAGQVRVVGADGVQMGIMETTAAVALAQEQELDLVEVAPQAEPPVCKIMDYGKWRFEEGVRAKQERKKQSSHVKGMRFRPQTSTHDYETKKRKIQSFLDGGSTVKVWVWFRGREMAHTDIGAELLKRLSSDLNETALVQVPPKLDGRNMVMVLAPVAKAKKTKKPTTT